MLDKINNLLEEISSVSIDDKDQLESFRLKFLSKKVLISDLFEEFRNVPPSEKKEIGQKLNLLKQAALDKYNNLRSGLLPSEKTSAGKDLTRPAVPWNFGSRHPISIIRNEIIEIFE